MALEDAPLSERMRFWKEHNDHGKLLGEHGFALKDLDRRVGGLERETHENYGAMNAKLDDIVAEVKDISLSMSREAAVREFLKEQGKESLGLKWPLVVSVIATICSVLGMAYMMLGKSVGV